MKAPSEAIMAWLGRSEHTEMQFNGTIKSQKSIIEASWTKKRDGDGGDGDGDGDSDCDGVGDGDGDGDAIPCWQEC